MCPIPDAFSVVQGRLRTTCTEDQQPHCLYISGVLFSSFSSPKQYILSEILKFITKMFSYSAKFEDLRAMLTNISIFWNMTPCQLVLPTVTNISDKAIASIFKIDAIQKKMQVYQDYMFLKFGNYEPTLNCNRGEFTLFQYFLLRMPKGKFLPPVTSSKKA